jgi:2,4-dienoyl-CoA reductase-like NADH-dependent reductase (Old Yellow Enzyme family)
MEASGFMICTTLTRNAGNVQINSKYLGQASDVSLNESITYQKQLEEWKAWAAACDTENVPTIVQINHPGRQSPPKAGSKGFFDKNVSSSAVLPLVGPGLFAWALSHLAFGTPKELSIDEIKDVVRQFAMTAKLAAEAGFAGIQIHAAHGYLLTQFMSAKVNRRSDKYGGSPAARVKIVLEIIEAIREVTPKNFCVGIKVNSVDQSSAELSDCIEQIKLIASAGVDFLEVSGGSMEDPSVCTVPGSIGKVATSFLYLTRYRCSLARRTRRKSLIAQEQEKLSSLNSRERYVARYLTCL